MSVADELRKKAEAIMTIVSAADGGLTEYEIFEKAKSLGMAGDDGGEALGAIRALLRSTLRQRVELVGTRWVSRDQTAKKKERIKIKVTRGERTLAEISISDE